MRSMKLFLLLLVSILAMPLAMADEIGSGGEGQGSSGQQSADNVEMDTQDGEAGCWFTEVLSWFE